MSVLPFRPAKVSVSEFVRELRQRGVTLTSDGTRLLAKPKRLLTDEDRNTIRKHMSDLLTLLDVSRDQKDEKRTEMVPLGCSAAPWDSPGLRNLLSVAQREGFRFGVVETGLLASAPATPTELWRLIREQATGLSRLLRDGV